jgi:hypothetical protein
MRYPATLAVLLGIEEEVDGCIVTVRRLGQAGGYLQGVSYVLFTPPVFEEYQV